MGNILCIEIWKDLGFQNTNHVKWWNNVESSKINMWKLLRVEPSLGSLCEKPESPKNKSKWLCTVICIICHMGIITCLDSDFVIGFCTWHERQLLSLRRTHFLHPWYDIFYLSFRYTSLKVLKMIFKFVLWKIKHPKFLDMVNPCQENITISIKNFQPGRRNSNTFH